MGSPFRLLVRQRPGSPAASPQPPEKPSAAPVPPGVEGPAPTLSTSLTLENLFDGLVPDRSLQPCPTRAILVRTEAELADVLEKCSRAGLMALDFETTGLDPHSHEVVSAQVTCEEGLGYYIPMGHRGFAGNLPRAQVMARLHRVVEDPGVRKPGHNLKFDYSWFLPMGFTEARNLWDTFIAAHVIDENRPRNRLGLKRLVAELLQYSMVTFSSLGIWTKAGPCPPDKLPDFSYLPIERALQYACADVDMVLRLYKRFLPEIDRDYSTAFYQIEMPLVPVLARMEFAGVELDEKYMRYIGQQVQRKIDLLLARLNLLVEGATPVAQAPEPEDSPQVDEEPEAVPGGMVEEVESFVAEVLGDPSPADPSGSVVGRVLEELNRNKWYKRPGKDGQPRKKAGFVQAFNWDSGDHILRLFRLLGIDTGRFTPGTKGKDVPKNKRRMSTDKKALQVLAKAGVGLGPSIAKALLGYRKLTKLHDAFCAKLPEWVHPNTGRVHPTFNQTNTVTGRLSCERPNMQQIPKHGASAKQETNAVRYPFRPKAGHVFIQCDYSQVELRILAHVAKDLGMIAAFQAGIDVHSQTALECYGGTVIPIGTTVGEVKKKFPELRDKSKAISFGLIYGMTAAALAEKLGCPLEEAKAYIKTYLGSKPKVEEFIVRQRDKMWNRGFVETPLGRRRHIPRGADGRFPFGWDRKAVNFPIQGGNAEIMKYVMARLTGRFDAEGLPAQIVLQIHDELIIECREDAAEKTRQVITEVFERNVLDLGYAYSVPLVADPAIQCRWAVKTSKCGSCGKYSLIERPGVPGGKHCLQCEPLDYPGVWDLEETLRAVEELALTEEEGE